MMSHASNNDVTSVLYIRFSILTILLLNCIQVKSFINSLPTVSVSECNDKNIILDSSHTRIGVIRRNDHVVTFLPLLYCVLQLCMQMIRISNIDTGFTVGIHQLCAKTFTKANANGNERYHNE